MKKIILITTCIFILAATPLAAYQPLANEDKQGLYVKSIDQVLRLEPEEIDIATAALIISEYWSDLVHGRNYLSKLDDMALEIRTKLEDKNLQKSPKAIPVINKYLFDEMGFKTIPTSFRYMKLKLIFIIH